MPEFKSTYGIDDEVLYDKDFYYDDTNLEDNLIGSATKRKRTTLPATVLSVTFNKTTTLYLLFSHRLNSTVGPVPGGRVYDNPACKKK